MPAPRRHLYWFAYFAISCPSVRYRGKYLLDELATAHDIPSTMVYPGYDRKTLGRFLKVYFRLLLFRPVGSWIVIQKIYTQGIYAFALKWLVRLRPSATIYELDDAEYLRHSPKTVDFFLRKCQCVIVGSRELEQYARQFNPNVHCIGSPILLQPRQPAPSNPVLTLCWIGFYNNHKESFEALVLPALERIDIPLKITLLGVNRAHQREELAAKFSRFPHITLEMPSDIDWLDESSVYARLSRCDLGLSPLRDTAFERAKSAFKLKQCLAAGIPVLVSPVGENVDAIDAGRNGDFFDDADSLRAKILAFAALTDADRQAMRDEAYRSAQPHSMAIYGQAVHAVLDQVH
jgi:glycosyltransferase involved in cell wall biosynthesis